jgi:hypothetical protein
VSSSEPYFEGLSLVRLNVRGDDAELRDELRAMVRDGSRSVRPPFEGEDASGSVWVSVSDLAWVENVEFSGSWSDRLQPGDVARALFESYHDAIRKAYTAAALLAFVKQQDDGSGPASADVPIYQVPPDDNDQQWLRAVRNTLEDVEIDIHRRSRGEVGPSREDAVSSPLGCFRARVRGNAVLEIVGDTVAIRDSSSDQLRQEALAVFRRAQGDGDGID